MMTSKEYLMQNQTAEQAVRNYEIQRDIKETNLISLKPVAFTVAAVLFVIYLLTSGVMNLPKQRIDNIVDDYNNEIIVDMNNMIGEVKWYVSQVNSSNTLYYN